MHDHLPLIVFSHLRWDFVFQRPQHLLSRLAKLRRVLFIEEPILKEDSQPSWNCSSPMPNLLVCKPQTNLHSPGFANDQLALVREMIPELLKQENISECVAWFYTPMALPLLDAVNEQAIVYDCMDELSAFRFAPPELLEREKELLEIADVVFTGGPSLYKAKKERNPNVHCFSSSVDTTHFGQARTPRAEPNDQAELPHPRLGFFGVIDERFDIELLDAVAKAHPEWQLVMVGPVVKIDPATLPRHSNITYTGQRSYADLPNYLCGWDVCLLPFARNESTKFISPTKTLEYMAAEKPIVSTDITDVLEPYGHIAYIGNNAETFITACEQALNEPEDEHTRRITAMHEVLANTSWDKTANEISVLIDQAVEKNLPQANAAPRERSSNHSTTGNSLDMDDSDQSEITDISTPPVVIIGAGPTGLSAAYHLGEDALLLEQHTQIGGWCRSIEDKGFTFDFAGHIMFSNDPYVHKMYEMLLGDNVHWQNREAWIYSKEVYTRYPFQGALYGLPPQVIRECIIGAIEARYGSLKPEPAANNSGSLKLEAISNSNVNGNGNSNGTNGACKTATNGVHNGVQNGTQNGHHYKNGNGHATRGPLNDKGDPITDCCADGVMESTAPLASEKKTALGASNAAPKNFEEFIYKVWGSGIAKHFAIPYNRKLWAVPLTEMETSWLGGRVPMPDLEEMIDGALQPVGKPMGPNARFGYPLRGGFQPLMNGFLPLLEGPVNLNSKIQKVSPSQKLLTLQDGEEIPYEQLISTMPLPVLIRLMGEEVPKAVRQAAAGLKHVSVRCVNIGVGREKLTDKHWIYYPEDTIFHRIFVQGNASPHCNPAGGFGLTCEITYCPTHKPLPCDGEDLIQRCITDCHRVGIFTPEDPILVANQVHMPHAYVVYDHARPKNVAILRDWLQKQDIYLAGRYSEWEYYNSDHAFLAGKKVADQVQAICRSTVTTVASV